MITTFNTHNSISPNPNIERTTAEFSGASFTKEINDVSGKSQLPLNALILLTFENLEELSEGFSEALIDKFHEAGIPTKPQIDIKYNIENNNVEIESSRDHNPEIKRLIESDPALLEKLRTLNSIASHVCEMPEHLAFQKEYLASNDPEQVIMKYAHLFSEDGQGHELSFKFDTNGIDIYYDGEYWVYF